MFGPNLTLNVQVIQDLALSVQAIKDGVEEALVPMTTDVDRSSRSVVVGEPGRNKHSVHNAPMGKDCGRGVAECTSSGKPDIHSRVIASPRESRLISADASAAFLSGWAVSDCMSTGNPGIQSKADASNLHGRRLRADSGAAFPSGWAVSTIPVHDVSAVTESEGVTDGNKREGVRSETGKEEERQRCLQVRRSRRRGRDRGRRLSSSCADDCVQSLITSRGRSCRRGRGGERRADGRGASPPRTPPGQQQR